MSFTSLISVLRRDKQRETPPLYPVIDKVESSLVTCIKWRDHFSLK